MDPCATISLYVPVEYGAIYDAQEFTESSLLIMTESGQLVFCEIDGRLTEVPLWFQ